MAKTPSSLRSIGLWTTAANAAVTLVLIFIAFVSTVFFGPAATGMLPGFLLTVALIAWTLIAYLLFWWLLRHERSLMRMTITRSAGIEQLNCN